MTPVSSDPPNLLIADLYFKNEYACAGLKRRALWCVTSALPSVPQNTARLAETPPRGPSQAPSSRVTLGTADIEISDLICSSYKRNPVAWTLLYFHGSIACVCDFIGNYSTLLLIISGHWRVHLMVWKSDKLAAVLMKRGVIFPRGAVRMTPMCEF